MRMSVASARRKRKVVGIQIKKLQGVMECEEDQNW
jgi:hypothetical protein